MQEFFKILENYKITPKNESLYIMALTHPSYQFEKKINYSNQRLEFLGDAIISKIVAEYLYKKHQQMDDGKMSAARAMIVQSKTLIKAGYELELEKYMLTGASIKNMKIFPEKIIEDCFESLCAAIYLDNNENTLYKLLKRTIIHYYETNWLNSNQNYKALLDNLLRKELYYKIKKNNDLFVATIYDNEKNLGVGKAKKIKEAKMLAAQAAYNSLKK